MEILGFLPDFEPFTPSSSRAGRSGSNVGFASFGGRQVVKRFVRRTHSSTIEGCTHQSRCAGSGRRLRTGRCSTTGVEFGIGRTFLPFGLGRFEDRRSFFIFQFIRFFCAQVGYTSRSI